MTNISQTLDIFRKWKKGVFYVCVVAREMVNHRSCLQLTRFCGKCVLGLSTSENDPVSLDSGPSFYKPDNQSLLTSHNQSLLTSHSQSLLTSHSQSLLTSHNQSLLTSHSQSFLTSHSQTFLTSHSQSLLTSHSQSLLTSHSQSLLIIGTSLHTSLVIALTLHVNNNLHCLCISVYLIID